MRKKFFVLLVTTYCSTLAADEVRVGGHTKYQYSLTSLPSESLAAQVGPDDPYRNEIDTRLFIERYTGNWVLGIHGEVLAVQGNGLEAQRQVLSQNPGFGSSSVLLSDQTKLFDLSQEFTDGGDNASVGRIDRFYVGYTHQSLSLKLGRQAISVGNSLAFPVLDLFNPFNPSTIDKDYKTGDDMLTATYGLKGGDSVQTILVPRRDIESGDVEASHSSLAVKYHGRLSEYLLDYDVLLAFHYDEPLLGFGVSYEALEAVWRSDVSVQFLGNGKSVTSFTAGVDRSWIWFDKNVYGFVELYFNELGESNENYESLDPALIERISRGEVFTVGRTYFTQGLQIEVTPLLSTFFTHFYNLHDSSGLFQVRAPYSLSDDSELMLGVNTTYGGQGTEYGGLSAGEGFTFGSGTTVYSRLQYYF